MALDPMFEPDWMAAEAERVFNDPEIRRRLADFERRLADGTLRTVPHEEVLRRFAWAMPGEPSVE